MEAVDVGWIELEDPGKVPTMLPGEIVEVGRVEELEVRVPLFQEISADVIAASGITGMLARGIGFDKRYVPGLVQQSNSVASPLNEVYVSQ